MDHSEAVAAGMVERFVLDELSGAELDAFEEHYFSCETCLVDVKAALDFRDAVRISGGKLQPAIAEPKVIPMVPSTREAHASGIQRYWGAWAAVLAVAFAGYQSFVTIPGLRVTIAELRQPHLFTGATVFRMGNRAVSPDSSVSHAGQPLHFFLELNTEPQFREYHIRIQPPFGPDVVSRVPADLAKDNVMLVIPKSVAGAYKITVSGDTGQGDPRIIQQGEISVQ
ncbi:MAG: zf-HC2 domain-containing protein [Acidobacteria bacterium]|nr:zf-HC2 domain-containing protein [Acidobacteriota bacterium]